MSEHIWASEIHYIDGDWYIHFTAGDCDDVWAIRPYILENKSESPFEGEWLEKGRVNTDFQSFSLDATTFEHTLFPMELSSNQQTTADRIFSYRLLFYIMLYFPDTLPHHLSLGT